MGGILRWCTPVEMSSTNLEIDKPASNAYQNNDSESNSSEEHEQFDDSEYVPRRETRNSVSAEVYGKHYNISNVKIPMYPKSEIEKTELLKALLRYPIFKELRRDEHEEIIKAFKPIGVQKGEVIIKQGEQGNWMYIARTGKATVTKDSNVVKIIHPNDLFGELAILYNAPRAATVVADEPMDLWCLDRESFIKLVQVKVIERRKYLEKNLANVDLIQSLSIDEKLKILDSLDDVYFDAGQVIFEKGDEGDAFYIIVNGTCELSHDGKYYSTVGPGTYFGDVAMITKKKRLLTVTAKEPLHAVKLSKEAFMLNFTQFEDILKKNIAKYEEIVV